MDRGPRRRLKRPLILAFAATVALLAVVLASDPRGRNVVAEALEALGETKGIIHMRVHEENFNADGSLVARSGTRPEIWVAREPLRLRVREATRSGSVFSRPTPTASRRPSIPPRATCRPTG